MVSAINIPTTIYFGLAHLAPEHSPPGHWPHQQASVYTICRILLETQPRFAPSYCSARTRTVDCKPDRSFQSSSERTKPSQWCAREPHPDRSGIEGYKNRG